ncbi:sigma factor-like helix-turn-helix DNA-binding protein [Arthrobacter koreensis]|uniref:sigma factor-like helix-turn-helix DNA-binding protein n=1 Tax=Arthrobacter koreensis TaxID=199136 RepID=UPI003D8A161E
MNPTSISGDVPLPPAQRDARMVARYVEGETLEAIGQDYGVTRERVRQIVTKVGGSLAAESRQKRLEARAAEAKATAEEFMTRYGDIAREASANGATRAETVARLGMIFPDLDKELADATLRDSALRFDKNSQAAFSKAVLEAGLYYLVGSELGIAPDPGYAAVHLEFTLMTELTAVLEKSTATAADIATILGIIGAAKRHIAEHPETTITGSRYDELREELVPALGWESRRGATPWPPTKQTLMGRYTYWNAALESVGMAPAKKGRQPGLVKFTEKIYEQAVGDFTAAMARLEIRPSYDRYAQWCADMNAAGHEYPSPSSLRNFFGSWSAALRMVGEPQAPAENLGAA